MRTGQCETERCWMRLSVGYRMRLDSERDAVCGST